MSTAQLSAHGIDSSTRSKWERRGLISRLGPRSFALAGSSTTIERAVAAGLFDLAGFGFVAGRTGARLHGLDGFAGRSLEYLVPRNQRHRPTVGLVCSTRAVLTKADTISIPGFRCLTVERLILESAQFDFTQEETENAIDSAIRLRLVSEQRLRTRVFREHRPNVNGSRLVLDALVDAGGESRLERWFLALVRQAHIDRPMLQKTYRDGTRTIARVDAYFPGGLVVEVSGHGTMPRADNARSTLNAALN